MLSVVQVIPPVNSGEHETHNTETGTLNESRTTSGAEASTSASTVDGHDSSPDEAMDPALAPTVSEILARRCPNLNRFNNGNAYNVKVKMMDALHCMGNLYSESAELIAIFWRTPAH